MSCLKIQHSNQYAKTCREVSFVPFSTSQHVTDSPPPSPPPQHTVLTSPSHLLFPPSVLPQRPQSLANSLYPPRLSAHPSQPSQLPPHPHRPLPYLMPPLPDTSPPAGAHTDTYTPPLFLSPHHYHPLSRPAAAATRRRTVSSARTRKCHCRGGGTGTRREGAGYGRWSSGLLTLFQACVIKVCDGVCLVG
jgi:hypothetical protein